MKKNKLIEILQNIKGNPEIVIWNGFVSDYQPISNKIHETYLYKETMQYQLDMINNERLRDNLEPITINDFKDESDYELIDILPEISYFSSKNKKIKDYYKKKKVIILETKNRNKTMYDRTGKINY